MSHNSTKYASEILESVNCLKKHLPYSVTLDTNNKLKKHPTKGGKGGDDCLWLGLLSSVIPGIGPSVLECQCTTEGGHYGMFCRNPAKLSASKKPHFSRDMALGVLVFLASNTYVDWPDKLWINWIEKIKGNRTILSRLRDVIVNFSSLKSGSKGLSVLNYRYALDDDGRSDITPSMWSIMNLVWGHRGVDPHYMMERCAGLDKITARYEAKHCSLGYRLHLKVVQAYIKMIINKDTETAKAVVDIAYERDSSNLFYKVLSKGVTGVLIDDFIRLCPKESKFTSRDYWLWEKSNVKEAIEDGKYCGWDWLFLGYLIANILEGKMNKNFVVRL